jgi:3-phenylpropionate/trans-cinnamate dioxygenase ferredoxin reductase subunit
MAATFVIVGAGQAAGQLIASLRTEGFGGRIILVGEEPHIPYQRPPLSKQFLAGEIGLEKVYLKPTEFYTKAGVELHLNTRVESIDRAEHTVQLGDGLQLHYGKLALTTGSRVRELAVPGATLPGIGYLRTADDALRLQAYWAPGRRLVIVGGGYIGLEVAAVAARQGVAVTVLEMESRIMQRVVGPQISALYAKTHGDAGVSIHTDTRVSSFAGDGRVKQVQCADGSTFEADAVLVGIGILPNSELADQAGLRTGDGIWVDEYARTSDPDIVAAGDCTNHPNSKLAGRLRLECVQNAVDQAKTAAATLCGKQREYAEIPRFWSDQYDLRLQIAGLPQSHDQVVIRGEPTQRAFAVFYLTGARMVCVEAVNRLQEFALSRRMIADRVPVDPVRLADPTIPIKEVAA